MVTIWTLNQHSCLFSIVLIFFKDLVVVVVSLFVLMVGPNDPLGGSGKYYSINFMILSTLIPQIMIPLLLSQLNSLVMEILLVDEFHD